MTYQSIACTRLLIDVPLNCEIYIDLGYCTATDLVLTQWVVSTEELQALADPQDILTPPRLLLRPMGGQPLP